MKKYRLLFALAAIELAFAIWNFIDDFGGFQNGVVSPYKFAQHVVPWAALAIIFFFQARRIRAREAGEA